MKARTFKLKMRIINEKTERNWREKVKTPG